MEIKKLVALAGLVYGVGIATAEEPQYMKELKALHQVSIELDKLAKTNKSMHQILAPVTITLTRVPEMALTIDGMKKDLNAAIKGAANLGTRNSCMYNKNRANDQKCQAIGCDDPHKCTALMLAEIREFLKVILSRLLLPNNFENLTLDGLMFQGTDFIAEMLDQIPETKGAATTLRGYERMLKGRTKIVSNILKELEATENIVKAIAHM